MRRWLLPLVVFTVRRFCAFTSSSLERSLGCRDAFAQIKVNVLVVSSS